MANVENILKVADAIENHSVPGVGFNMGWLTLESSVMSLSGIDLLHVENCGTVACIAGWANALAGSLEDPTFKVAQDFLGLDGAQHSQLFYASTIPTKPTTTPGRLKRSTLLRQSAPYAALLTRAWSTGPPNPFPPWAAGMANNRPADFFDA